jgi:AraC-like DNA-binding protein
MPQSQPAHASERLATLPDRRRTEFLPDGAYLFEDELSGGLFDATVITCAAWLLELYELRSGDVGFEVGTENVRPTTNCFGVFYPPFSLTRPRFNNPQGRVLGIAGSIDLPTELLGQPLVFETAFRSPGTAIEAISLVRSGANRQSIDPCPSASLLSLKAKRLIDENYLAYPSIARVAERVGVSHAHLSRQFKRDFGMSPSEYLRRLRVADAPLRLARGEDIINVSLDVGYNDLSRFYKQFRQTTNTSPGTCKTLLRPRR